MKQIKLGFDEQTIYEKKVNKVRAIVINNKGNCLLVKYAGLYMLPGGKIDEGESDIQALKREILEEAGIEIEENKITQPYLEISTYDKDYYDRQEKKNINRITNTKFYIVNTNQEIDETKKHLTESEKEKKQTIEFINLSKIRYLVETNVTENEKKKNFDREILTALKEFENFRNQNIDEMQR